MLPSDVDVVGIDEHTALMLDFAAGTAVVFGRGGVSWLRDGSTTRLEAGAPMPLAALGLTRHPDSNRGHSTGGVGRRMQHGPFEQSEARAARAGAGAGQARAQARANGDWALSDRLRLEIAAAGWQVRDTPEGPLVVAD